MKCKKCNKPIKENTEGNKKYCQGHSIIDYKYEPNKTKGQILKEIMEG
jgi:hypothetical protein